MYWTQPKQLNGIIVGYVINMNSSDGQVYSQSVNATTTGYEIPLQILLLCRQYYISLAAKTRVGAGMSKTASFPTKIEGSKQ